MSFLSRLIALVSEPPVSAGMPAEPGPTDARLAGAALLVHVARVDGRLDESERARLLALIGARFRLDPPEAERFVARAAALDHEAGLEDLVELLGHECGEAERRDLLGMAYEVAMADGRLLEFEDDLVWRVGHLLGLDDAAILGRREVALAAGAGTSS